MAWCDVYCLMVWHRIRTCDHAGSDIGTEQEAHMGAGCRTRAVTPGTRCQAKSTDARGSALYKLNIVGLDAFLKLTVAIASIPYCMAGSG